VRIGLRAVGSALAQVLTHVSASLLSNLLVTLLSVPLIVALGVVAFGTRSFSLVPLGVVLLIGVLPNPCAAGMHSVVHTLAAGEFVTFKVHWDGLRRYAGPAAVAWLFSVAVTAILLANLAFYARAAGSGTGTLRSLALPLFLGWLALFIAWLSLHLYVFPLLIEQEVKSIRLVYRNAALMALARPSVLIVVVPLWVSLLVVASTTGLATFLGLALGASIQHNIAAKLLPSFKLRKAG
jgi:hypothetical protein